MLTDLTTKTYHIERNFFTPDVINSFLCEYSKRETYTPFNKYYATIPTDPQWIESEIGGIVRNITSKITKETGIRCDCTISSAFLSIKHGVNFGWHQEHDKQYQSLIDTDDYLNFINIWVPLIKPDKMQSNLDVIDMSKLVKLCPEAHQLVGRGATNLMPKHDHTVIRSGCGKEDFIIPFNIESIKQTLEVEVGDAIVMRGDCIHKTQDTQTERVALSLRRINGDLDMYSRQVVANAHKLQHYVDNSDFYLQLISCFDDAETPLTVREVQARMRDM